MGYYFMPGMSIDDVIEHHVAKLLVDDMLSKLDAPKPLPIPILKPPVNEVEVELTKEDIEYIHQQLEEWGIDTEGFDSLYG